MAAGETITTVVVPATAYFKSGQVLDLIDLATLKDDLKIPDSASDAFLRRVITRASQKAATYCNRLFQPQTYQDQIWPARDPFPQQVTGGLKPLQLMQWPSTWSACQAGIAPPAWPNQIVAPPLLSVPGGSLPARSYYVRATYVTALGETPVSSESFIRIAAGNLLQVTSPQQDTQNLATGWNIYVSNAAGQETLQNATPVAIGTNWTEPGGLTVGAAFPQSVAVVENNIPLCEGVDFIAKPSLSQLIRLDPVNGYERKWPAFPIVVLYQAGFTAATLPTDLIDAVQLMVKQAWFARTRDPMLKQENVAGAYEASYWISAFVDRGAMTPEVTSLLDAYRVPVFG
jgi:hypothetical protein